MGTGQWLALDAVAAVLLLFLLYLCALVVRRRVLSRHGGTFELSHRARPETAGRGWVLGLGRYAGDRLEFFRIFSVLPRPQYAWPRADLSYRSTREPEAGERRTLYAGHLVVLCDSPAGEVELAMSPGALTGLQAWLEAAPPGEARRQA